MPGESDDASERAPEESNEVKSTDPGVRQGSQVTHAESAPSVKEEKKGSKQLAPPPIITAEEVSLSGLSVVD